jgi:hypothetical protein
MNPQEKASLHAAVARNTGEDPTWMGFWLARHREHERLAEPQLAKKLGVSMDNLVLLRLCRTPRSERFREDVEAICRRTGATERELLGLLRQEQNLYQLKQGGPPSGRGWLMAASDRPEGEQGPVHAEDDHEPTAD